MPEPGEAQLVLSHLEDPSIRPNPQPQGTLHSAERLDVKARPRLRSLLQLVEGLREAFLNLSRQVSQLTLRRPADEYADQSLTASVAYARPSSPRTPLP